MKKIVALLIAAGISMAAVAAPETYDIDSTHSFSRFSYSHFGYSNQESRFDSTTGKIVLDRAAKTGSVDVVIDAKSVNTGYPVFNGHIQGEDFFDTAKFPTITYKSTKFNFDGDVVPVHAAPDAEERCLRRQRDRQDQALGLRRRQIRALRRRRRDADLHG